MKTRRFTFMFSVAFVSAFLLAETSALAQMGYGQQQGGPPRRGGAGARPQQGYGGPGGPQGPQQGMPQNRSIGSASRAGFDSGPKDDFDITPDSIYLLEENPSSKEGDTITDIQKRIEDLQKKRAETMKWLRKNDVLNDLTDIELENYDIEKEIEFERQLIEEQKYQAEQAKKELDDGNDDSEEDEGGYGYGDDMDGDRY